MSNIINEYEEKWFSVNFEKFKLKNIIFLKIKKLIFLLKIRFFSETFTIETK